MPVRRGCRCALPVALLSSWVDTATFAPTGALLVALLTVLPGGFILLNVFTQEIPSGRRSSFPWVRTIDDLRRVADPDHCAERGTS